MATTGVVFDSTSYATVAATAYDDMSLVRACMEGDAGAFEQLVKRYDSKLFRIAQHITHNREDAQDAVQDAFLKAFRKLTQFRGNSQFSTWLIRITVNESLMKLRKQRSSREVSIDEDFSSESPSTPHEFADWAPNPEKLYEGSELRNILRTELQELRPSLRVVFVLRDVEGLSTDKPLLFKSTGKSLSSRSWRVPDVCLLLRARRKSRSPTPPRVLQSCMIAATRKRSWVGTRKCGFDNIRRS